MRTTNYKNRRGGHSPGHVRETFLAALEAYLDWDEGDPEPTVEFEVNYKPRQITISKAAGLVWNCSDVLPGYAMESIADTHLDESVHLRERRPCHGAAHPGAARSGGRRLTRARRGHRPPHPACPRSDSSRPPSRRRLAATAYRPPTARTAALRGCSSP